MKLSHAADRAVLATPCQETRGDGWRWIGCGDDGTMDEEEQDHQPSVGIEPVQPFRKQTRASDADPGVDQPPYY